MENGFSKLSCCVLCLFSSLMLFAQQYEVKVSSCTADMQDLSQRSSKYVDHNGEVCALIKFETPIPNMIRFDLGDKLKIEHREDKEDEVWIWVSPDIKKMTISCDGCTPLRGYRVSLQKKTVYRAKITTNLPQETSMQQYLNIFCETIPFTIQIDGTNPIKCKDKLYNVLLPIGSHDVQITSPLKKVYNKTIRLTRGDAYLDTVRLEDYFGEVTIRTNVKVFQVFVDGQEQELQSQTIKVEQGAHLIRVQKDMYGSEEKEVNVPLFGKIKLDLELVPRFAQFTITAKEPETCIFIDNEYAGREKVTRYIEYGTHTIEGRRVGYDTYVCPITDFHANSEKNISIPRLTQQYGALNITVDQSDATFYIDGKNISLTEGNYVNNQMPVGTHFIHIVKTDYRTKRDTIEIQSRKVYSKNYVLEHLSLGKVYIQTDPEISIFLKEESGDLRILGKGTYSAKLPAGIDTILLENQYGVRCQYVISVVEQEEIQNYNLPYTRKLKIRISQGVGRVTLKDEKQQYVEVKADKNLKLSPQKYVLNVEKNGYSPYEAVIDLSAPDVKELVYRADLSRIGDTIQRPFVKPTSVRHKFYDYSGRSFVGIIGIGYAFDFSDMSHHINLGVLSFRWKMLGISLLDFDFNVSQCLSDKKLAIVQLNYTPKLSLVIPCAKSFAMTAYAGPMMNVSDWFVEKVTENPRLQVFGGVSAQISGIGKVPMNIFAEYHYPIQGYDKPNKLEKQFRVGVNFSFGVDK